ncbi:hypothetical protein [Alkalicoccus chagannorensis]|uniref:hypothetical protein n=1 Tax=Alkalicoccus chagannorensis TaxID=427072 RepID=UPI000686B07C|nr:hypothetical protein [Alkalicoccus chagannorensis]
MQGLFIPAGLFIGMGIGLVFDAPDVGLFIGMGVGFLLMPVYKLVQLRVQPQVIEWHKSEEGEPVLRENEDHHEENRRQ